MIAIVKKFPVDAQKILRKGKLLNDEEKVSEIGMQEGDFIVVMVNVKVNVYNIIVQETGAIDIITTITTLVTNCIYLIAGHNHLPSNLFNLLLKLSSLCHLCHLLHQTKPDSKLVLSIYLNNQAHPHSSSARN
jgi:hypothetical protein